MAEFQLNRIRFTWKGSWTSGSDYVVDDMIEYEGKTYVALRVHTAATFSNDIEGADVSPSRPKWELQSDGVVWKGNWTTSTTYSEGAIVKYGSGIYQCIEEHVSSPTFSSGTDGLIEDITKWKVVAVSDTDWKYNWSTSTLYRRNDIVRYNGRVYKALEQHISASTNAVGLEADQNKWAVLSDSDSWRGDWGIGTRYRTNDIIKYGGIVYRCTIGHTSADNVDIGLEQDQGKWEILVEGTQYRFDWTSEIKYRVNDVVKRGPSVVKCITAHVSGEEFTDDGDKWEVYLPGQEYEGDWEDGTRYQPGDIARYGGYTYKALTYNIGTPPSTNPSDWDLNLVAYRFRKEWNKENEDSSFVDYKTGDVVRFSGNVYLATADNFNQQPDLHPNVWEVLVDGRQFRNVWEDNVEYYPGDIVTWQGTSYIALKYHRSTESDSRPDLDVNNTDDTYWKYMIKGTLTNKLARVGDIKTYDDQDSTAVDTQRLAIGTTGQALRSTSNLPAWDSIDKHRYVYYVAPHGIDDESQGDTLNAPFRTLRFACNYILRDEKNRSGLRDRFFERATNLMRKNVDFIKDETTAWIDANVEAGTGIWSSFTYNAEKCARDVAIIVNSMATDMTYTGNEQTRRAAQSYWNGAVSLVDGQQDQTVAALNFARDLINDYVLANSQYSSIQSKSTQYTDAFTSETGAADEVTDYMAIITDVVANGLGSLPTLVKNPPRGGATIRVMTGDYAEILPIIVPEDVAIVGDELRSTTIRPAEEGRDVILSERTNLHGIIQPQEELVIPTNNNELDMFRVRNGCGIRQLSLKGLTGELSDANDYGTKRPTGGAFVSLDPGEGPDDQRVWVRDKSTYVQGVTTIGNNCVGMKIDGALHNGGNRSCVANDFTQVLSDGIGYWASNGGRSELVSVFTYYAHIGYLAEEGGILRATNGNNSYGTFGSVAEGFSATEIPITGEVNNQSLEAQVQKTYTDTDEVMAFGYYNAGQHYTTASIDTINSAGTGLDVEWNEFRDNAVSDVRILKPEDSSTAGGAGYKFITNFAQSGTSTTITLAQSEERLSAQLVGMRIYITSGRGVGQYGWIQSYNEVSKLVTVYKESTNTIGWDNILGANQIELTLDETTKYEIEPRVSVADPDWNSTTNVTRAGLGIMGFAGGNFYYALSGTNDVEVSTDSGTTWTTNQLENSATWSAIAKSGPMMLIASQGSANLHYSNEGTLWDYVDLGETWDWTGVAVGGRDNDTVILCATGQDNVLKGTITQGVDSSIAPDTWTTVSLPASRDWVDITYGAGLWIVISSDGYTAYSQDNGDTWTGGLLPAPSSPEAYNEIVWGDNKFVASVNDADRIFYSPDGVNWLDSDLVGDSVRQDWNIAYAGGEFVAVGSNGTLLTSDDSANWIQRADLPGYGSVAGGVVNGQPTWLTKDGSDTGVTITGGRRALMRVTVANNNLNRFIVLDPGSGYATTPLVTVTDPEEYIEPLIQTSVNDGVLPQPTFYNRGTGYITAVTTLTGDGYADIYQLGQNLVLKNVAKIPGPGANLRLAGQPDTIYRIVLVEKSSGVAPNFDVTVRISPLLAIDTSPDHEEAITIREDFSQVRLTGHDFLDIGTGNFEDTNYPELYVFGREAVNETRQANEIVEANGGRVFYTSTDQDGNFRVGELFRVAQASGGLTLNADFFDLGGLDELRLGGIQVGGTQATIREFSTDNTMTANSDAIIPTQRAIGDYLENRITGGGATLFTNKITAGVVFATNNEIGTTEGIVNFSETTNFTGGVDGDMLANSLFMAAMTSQDDFNG